MSYPYAKFQHDMSINNGIHCICPVYCFVYFWTNDRGLSIMTLLSMTRLISIYLRSRATVSLFHKLDVTDSRR